MNPLYLLTDIPKWIGWILLIAIGIGALWMDVITH